MQDYWCDIYKSLGKDIYASLGMKNIWKFREKTYKEV